MNNRERRRLYTAQLLSLAVGLLLLLAARAGFFSTLQAQSTDFLFKAKSGETSTRVGIVAIDERTVRELAGDGRVFNWPRSYYARVITALTQAGARVVALDILFDAPTNDDETLAKSIAAGNVVLPVAGDLPVAVSEGAPLSFDILASPLPSLSAAAASLGHANVHPDGDGTVRREQLVIASQGKEVPSIALGAAARYLRRPESIEGPPQGGFFSFAGRAIPIADSRRGMVINYLGPPYQDGRQSPFPVLSFVDVLQGRADLAAMKDRIVLIGLTAAGFADDYWVPSSVSRKMSGVEVHANAIETILRPAFFRSAGGLEMGIVIIGFALISGFCAYRLRILPAVGIAAILVVMYLLGSFILFDRGVLVNLVYPPLAPPLAFAAVAIYRVLFAEADQRVTRRLLSGYLSPSLMKEVLKDPEQLHLGGERRIMTVLFSDLRGFTTYSEAADPEILVRVLNEYLTEMSAVVFDRKGVIDKYMGDGIMTFWGAPMEQEDHARLACQAAIDMIERLHALNTRWEKEGVPPFKMGIGVNTGAMSVGNMGSRERFSYTAVGDAVNLTARMEGLNKLFGTSIVVSESTLQAAGEGFASRFLGLIAVVGKQEPVAVYELLQPLGIEVREKESARAEMLRHYVEGIRLGKERRYTEAASAFERALVLVPEDGPSNFHLKNLATLAENPPAEGWDGDIVATTK